MKHPANQKSTVNQKSKQTSKQTNNEKNKIKSKAKVFNQINEGDMA